jgi:SAM-dependent methyltransferase
VATSLVYRSATLYDLVMRLLYGRHHADRDRAIAALIPDRASVVDLCCGPGFLYERHLRRKGVDYLGLDINPGFIRRVERLGARAEIRDLRRDEPLPAADFVVMQASLYQFLPEVAPILARMRAAARTSVIVAEPIRNLATGQVPLVSAMARRMANPGPGRCPRRFDQRSLEAALGDPAWRTHSAPIPGGREQIYVLRGTNRERSAGGEDSTDR